MFGEAIAVVRDVTTTLSIEGQATTATTATTTASTSTISCAVATTSASSFSSAAVDTSATGITTQKKTKSATEEASFDRTSITGAGEQERRRQHQEDELASVPWLAGAPSAEPQSSRAAKRLKTAVSMDSDSFDIDINHYYCQNMETEDLLREVLVEMEEHHEQQQQLQLQQQQSSASLPLQRCSILKTRAVTADTEYSGSSSTSLINVQQVQPQPQQEEEFERQMLKDPLCELLSDDVLCRVTGFLDAYSLTQLRAVNRHYRQLASSNRAGWKGLCEHLFHDKVHVGAEAMQLYQQATSHHRNNDNDDDNSNTQRIHGNPEQHQQSPPLQDDENNACMRAYKMALHDAKHRGYMTRDELCYDPKTGKGTVWSFRFKESAGTDWTAVDPWWSGLPARKLVFLQNGSIKLYLPPTPPRPSSSSSSPLQLLFDQDRVVAEMVGGDTGNDNDNNDDNTEQQQQQHAEGAPVLRDPPLRMTWRFLTRPMDLPQRPMGSYVRCSVGGREVPTYAVRRSPTGNWGFVMESCWGLYASFELPPRRMEPSLPDPPPGRVAMNETGAAPAVDPSSIRQRQQRRPRRTENGDIAWVIPDEGEDGENGEEILVVDDHHRPSSNRYIQQQQDTPSNLDDLLGDDASLLITNEIQWREAFLYNVGARVLPEGDVDAEEFDRTWGAH